MCYGYSVSNLRTTGVYVLNVIQCHKIQENAQLRKTKLKTKYDYDATYIVI